MKIAVLGLGIIGEAWAKNLRNDGLSLSVWNRSPKNSKDFVADAGQAAADAKLIILVVADPPAVEQVLDRIQGSLRPGQIVAQCSTVSAAWTLRFAERVEKTGARFLEAPFTGSRPAAEARKTVFYLGGSAEILESARPVLGRLGTLMHIGPVGSASSLKLAMNMNIAMVMQGLSESLRFSRSHGIPDAVFFEALKVNSSRSGISEMKEPKLKSGDYAPQFSLKHMDKDLRLALESAGALDLPQLTRLKSIYDEGMRRGFGDEDFSSLLRLL